MAKVTVSKKNTAKSKKAMEEEEGMLSVDAGLETVDESENSDEDVELVPALQELFLSSIKDIYWAENHLVKALPKMHKAATSETLKNAINDHLVETKEHVARLEKVFVLLGKKPQAKKCDAMEGITMEGEEILEETKKGTATRDVGIILASQKVEHYEIATYGGLVQLASILGEDEVADILRQTLSEEKLADQKLTEVAENNINFQASEE